MKKELYNYLNDMLTKKDFDNFTSQKIIEYVEAHDLLYGNIIDTKDVIQRISTNLNNNIQFDLEHGGFGIRGGYSPTHKQIVINTDNFKDDEYFHEIDHCATSDLSSMPDFDAPDAFEFEVMDKRYKEGYKYYMGIEVDGQEPAGSDFRIAMNENEGITTLKQIDYAKLRGTSFNENGYNINYNMAEQIGYIIGRDNLLQKHFYNNIEGIRNDLDKYGINYNQLLELSGKIQNTDHMSIQFYENTLGTKGQNDIEKYKEIYQNIMFQGFVAKRCQELGIQNDDYYYTKLNRNQRKTELQELDKFAQFKICDTSILEHIRSEITPKKLPQIISKFLNKFKTKQLPEELSKSDNSSNLNDNSTKETFKSWKLKNWGIDKQQFQNTSYQIAQNIHEENQIDQNTREDHFTL